jgi:hypothetical protein
MNQETVQEIQKQLRNYNRIPSQAMNAEGQHATLLVYGPITLQITFLDNQILGEETDTHEVLLQLPPTSSADRIASQIAAVAQLTPDSKQARLAFRWQQATPKDTTAIK